MRPHSQTRKRTSRRRRRSKVVPAAAPTGFLGAWTDMIGPAWMPTAPRRRGRKPRVPINQLLQALTFHVTQDAGTLAQHFFELFREPLANRSWSDRRMRLPWEIVADLMRRALRPLATRRREPAAFWRGWRLLAIDRTPCSVPSTPQVTTATTTAAPRPVRASFAT